MEFADNVRRDASGRSAYFGVLNRPVWDERFWTPLDALDADVRADVCVIGLGASGLTAVLEVLALGHSVVGIDATRTLGGAAGANGGVLRAGLSKFHHEAVAAFGRARAAELYRMSAAEIDRIEAETPQAVRRVGSLRVAADDAEWRDCEAQLAALIADGIAAEARETTFGRGLFIPRDGAMQPMARGQDLARTALARGARLYERTPAIAWTGSAVKTPGGTVGCGGVVIAVDGGLEQVVPSLKGTVRTTRLQMLATEPARDVEIPCPVSANGGFDYWQQLPDKRIALGGGRNQAFEREWGAPAVPSDEIQRYLDGVLRLRIGTSATVTHRWAARVAYTDDGLPVLAAAAPNVWVTGAYSGTGNLMGAICGRCAARLACGELKAVPPLFAREAKAA